MNSIFIFSMLAIISIYFINTIEKFDTTLVNYQKCEKCNVYNHLDSQTYCDNACKKRYVNKSNMFTGDIIKISPKELTCKCSFKAEKKNNYFGCITPESNGNKDCFFFNNEDAKRECPKMCQKLAPSEGPVNWTGKWKNDDINRSSCECSYYE